MATQGRHELVIKLSADGKELIGELRTASGEVAVARCIPGRTRNGNGCVGFDRPEPVHPRACGE